MLAASQTFQLQMSMKYEVPNSLHNTYCKIDNEEKAIQILLYTIFHHQICGESGFTLQTDHTGIET